MSDSWTLKRNSKSSGLIQDRTVFAKPCQFTVEGEVDGYFPRGGSGTRCGARATVSDVDGAVGPREKARHLFTCAQHRIVASERKTSSRTLSVGQCGSCFPELPSQNLELQWEAASFDRSCFAPRTPYSWPKMRRCDACPQLIPTTISPSRPR